jgi:hypothetical protein
MSERLRGTQRHRLPPEKRDPEQEGARRRRLRIAWAAVLIVMVVAGAVLAATSRGSVIRSAAAILLLGGAAVLVVSLAFLEVGISEDEERGGRFGRPVRGDSIDPELERRWERFFRG